MAAFDQLIVRDAQPGDLPALAAINGPGSEALHLDRMRDAQRSGLRYLVLLDGQELAGFVLLVFRRPAYWSDGADTTHLPQIEDLQVAEGRRGQGLGTAFIGELERIAAQAGYAQLYLAVDPVDNPRACALYRRLGYRQLQSEPYRSAWEFTDSGGQRHHGEEWTLDMVKELKGTSGESQP